MAVSSLPLRRASGCAGAATGIDPRPAQRRLHQGIETARQRAADAHAGHTVEHELCDGAQRLDIKAKANGGICGAKGVEGLNQCRCRQHDIHGDGNFRFQAANQPAGACEQPIHAERDASGIGQDGAAGLTQLRPARRLALEQRQAELAFEIGDGVAHHRGGAAQLSGGAGEAASLRNRQEHLQMIEARGFRLHCSAF